MAFTDDQLNDIYDRTFGYCHICRKKLAFTNYGQVGRKAAWEVEHSRPRARGGTDHMNNLYPACIPCNRSKGKGSTRTARAQHGHSRAPLSRSKREQSRTNHAISGALVGAVGGRGGAVLGGLVGACLGHNMDPDQE